MIDTIAAAVVYAVGWLLTARTLHARAHRKLAALWREHAERHIGYRHYTADRSCEAHYCTASYQHGFDRSVWTTKRCAYAPALAMAAALVWPLLALAAAVTWQRPTPETPAEAAARLQRELDAEFGKEN